MARLLRSMVVATVLLTVGAASGPARADFTFQQGADGYTGHRDVQVRNDTGNLDLSSNTGTNVTGYLPPSGAPGSTATLLRGLHTWNLSSIPQGAVVTGVTLTFSNRSDTGASIDDGNSVIDAGDPLVVLRTISVPITEPTGSTSTGSGSNWNNTFGAGMTLGPVLSSARFDPEIGENIHTVTFPSTVALITAVQAALDSPSRLFNFAVMLADESGSSRIAIQMGSNTGDLNGSDPTLPPRPILTFHYLPEPASMAIVSLCGLLALGRRRH